MSEALEQLFKQKSEYQTFGPPERVQLNELEPDKFEAIRHFVIKGEDGTPTQQSKKIATFVKCGPTGRNWMMILA